jgi:type IV pilus assembly protein PilA
MLARLRKVQEENEGGFTLIELLVVVIIIGILAAIAIPTFLSQREKAWDKAALSDLRNVAVQLEEIETGYPATVDADTADEFNALVKPKYSEGVSYVKYAKTAAGYCFQVAHSSMSGATYALNSVDGRPKKGTTC